MSQYWDYLSATPPTGLDSSVVKACYKFDGPTLGLTDRSPNSHTLAFNSSVGCAWHPMQAEFGCNGVLIRYQGSWLYSAPSSLLATAGVATMEFVFARYYIGALDDSYNGYMSIGGGSEGEADNVQFSLYGSGVSYSNKIGVLVEKGSGVNVAAEFPDGWILGVTGQLQYFCCTRESDGKTYHLFVDGKYLDTLVLPDAPTGGSTARVYFQTLAGATNVNGGIGVYQSARWSHAQFSEDQVEETYYQLRTAA